MSIEKRNFTPSAQNPQWYKLSLILPSIYNNSMSVIEAFQPMLDCINDVNQNFNELVDWTNTRDDELVDYLNQQLEDFTNANNEFYQKIDNLVQQFMEDMTADFEAFKTEIKQIVEDYKNYLDQKYQEFTENMTAEFNALKQAFEELKAKVDKFMTDMTAAFEAFKQEIMNLIKGIQDEVADWQEEWEQYKLQIKAYVDGLFDGLEQFIKDNLETIVKKLLKEVFGETAGICLGYDADSNTINLLYDEHFARDEQNRLTLVSGAGGGGDSIEAGQGIDMQDNPETHKKTVSVKLAADGGLEFTEDGSIRSTGGSGSGDTIVAGEGIKVAGEGTKTVQSAPATSQTLGGVKTGDSDVTGLTVAEDGTISIKKWSPIDITKDFEFFDSNLENVAPLWTLDGQYSPNGRQFTLYGRMSESAIESIGIPQAATITWNPDSVWEYDTRPIAGAIQTNSLIQNATFSVRIDLPSTGARNGSGEIQFSWKGKENVSKLQFKVVKADLDLDEKTPVVIAGTPIGEGGSITFENLDMKSIGFKMKDGTIVSDLQKIKNSDRTDSVIGIEAQNKNCALQGSLTPRLQAKNLVDGPVSLKIKRSAFGIQTDQTLSSLININVNFQNSVWDGVKLICQASDNTIDNFTTNNTLQFLFPGYSGANAGDFEITQDDGEVVGIGALGKTQSNMTAGNQITLFAGRFGTVNLTLRTRTYATTFTKTISITVRQTDNVPHIKLTTNQTSVGDQALDIANPRAVEIKNISKAQGVVTFWAQAYPSKNYVYRDDSINIDVKLNNVQVWGFQIRFDTDLNNKQFTVDLASHAVGELFTIEYNATRFEQPVNITFGKVVD